MLISPFTPLFFIGDKSDGLECPYIQTFANTDQILFQAILDRYDIDIDDYYFGVENLSTGGYFQAGHSTWEINADERLAFFVLQGLSNGIYRVFVYNDDETIYSQPFKVTDNPAELRDTTLIQYSMKNNRQRKDAVFIVDGMPYFFDFRVPGGFKDSGWTFGVNNEIFTTDQSDIISLYARENVQQRFTMGTSEGCPIWFGALLNRLLCCDYVYFDGVRYARKDSSVPEVTAVQEGINSFVFGQNLQQVVNLSPRIEDVNHSLIFRHTAYYGTPTMRLLNENEEYDINVKIRKI